MTSVLAAAAVYPVLVIFEHESWYPKLFVEKRPGEIRNSLLLLCLMFAVLIAVCWGAFGQPVVAATAILMWGFGDAAAALVGIPYGKHKFRSKLTDGKKSWEGSSAMLAVSVLAGCIMLIAVLKDNVPHALASALIGAVFGTAAELFSPSEYDTVTVPVVIAAVLLIIGRV